MNSAEETRNQLSLLLQKNPMGLTAKEVAKLHGLTYGTIYKHLQALVDSGRALKRWDKSSFVYEHDDAEKREYRRKKDAAKETVALKRKLGVKTYALLMRSLATVKTPGLRAEIEEIKREVEACSKQGSLPILSTSPATVSSR